MPREREREREREEKLLEELREINQQLLVASVRQQELADAAERHSAEMTALLESLTEGVAVVDTTGRVVLMNPVAREILRLPQKKEAWTLEDYRQLDLRRVDGVPLPFEEWPICRAFHGERFDEHEAELVRPDGSRRRLVFNGNSVRDARGNLVVAINVFRDVTERRELEEAREDFIYTISHDLRAPLSIIQGHAQMAQRHVNRADMVRKSTEAILTSARRMNAMIQDLVDSARLETGQMRIEKQPVNLETFVYDLMERARGMADVGRIEVEVAAGLPAVLADPDRLERIFMNLLTNALKYSPPETEIRLKAERTNGEVTVSVTDRGQGIPPEDVPHIFERYYRARTTTRKAEGLGLGLYITRMLVQAHGGRIWVKSKIGKGSTFYFALPLA